MGPTSCSAMVSLPTGRGPVVARIHPVPAQMITRPGVAPVKRLRRPLPDRRGDSRSRGVRDPVLRDHDLRASHRDRTCLRQMNIESLRVGRTVIPSSVARQAGRACPTIGRVISGRSVGFTNHEPTGSSGARRKRMSELIVIGFDNPVKARAAYDGALALQTDFIANLQGVAVVTVDA